MARKLVCDRCLAEDLETEEIRKEYTDLKLLKLGGPAFQQAELCPNCTANLRLWLQGGLFREENPLE